MTAFLHEISKTPHMFYPASQTSALLAGHRLENMEDSCGCSGVDPGSVSEKNFIGGPREINVLLRES